MLRNCQQNFQFPPDEYCVCVFTREKRTESPSAGCLSVSGKEFIAII